MAKKQVVEHEALQREMDAAMESYMGSRRPKNAVQVLELVDTILNMDEPDFIDLTESAREECSFYYSRPSRTTANPRQANQKDQT
eukprot:scaffold39703_cov191-Amphora_coffeaeformis.AAC.1